MDAFNEWHKAKSAGKRFQKVAWIVCNDGFTASIQAGSGFYCEPEEDAAWPYSRFEIGYPSEPDDVIGTYAEDPDARTGTIYPRVPLSNVLLLIEKHGGIKEPSK